MESNMSVSAVANNNGTSLRRADTQSALHKASTTKSAANTTGSDSTTGTSAAESSTQVTLSPLAQILAQFAAAGITFTLADAEGNPVSPASLSGVTLPTQSAGESINDYAMQVCSAIGATGLNVSMTDPGGISMSIAKMSDLGGTPSAAVIQQIAQDTNKGLIAPPTSGGSYDGNISQSSFDKVIEQFGGTKAEADKIFASLDTDHNGSISHSELLNAMSQLGSSTASSGIQALQQLLVPSGNSSLDGGEFLKFESAMVAAETPAG
jgi:Ca2+-binding EF-hand superfamily protein